MTRFPEVHVYGNKGVTHGSSIVLRNPETGDEIDLAPWMVLCVERKMAFGEVVSTSVTFAARLVEHEEQYEAAA